MPAEAVLVIQISGKSRGKREQGRVMTMVDGGGWGEKKETLKRYEKVCGRQNRRTV